MTCTPSETSFKAANVFTAGSWENKWFYQEMDKVVEVLQKLQVKTVRSAPWYVKATSYSGELADQLTIFVLLGKESAEKQVRYFITRNSQVADRIHHPPNWKNNGFMFLNAVKEYEDRWDIFTE